MLTDHIWVPRQEALRQVHGPAVCNPQDPGAGVRMSTKLAGQGTFFSPFDRGTLSTTLRPINPAVQQLLRVYRRLLESHFGERLVQLTLFGSYARGEARADSDIDVAVVLDAIRVPSERTLPMELAGDLVAEYGQVIVPLVLSVSELELLRQREDLLAANLEREGIVQ